MKLRDQLRALQTPVMARLATGLDADKAFYDNLSAARAATSADFGTRAGLAPMEGEEETLP